MKVLFNLTKRNINLFFKDKAMFFTSMITPLILVLLYVTFLANVYRDTITNSIPEGIEISKKITEGFVGGWLFSSLLSVSCVTIAFCSNILMVQDKYLGVISDMSIAPVKKTTLSISYFLASSISTMIVCYVAFGVGVVYLLSVGWYLSALDVILIILDIFLLSLFGTALSSIVNYFLTTQGQVSAVSTIVSCAYGFISGAYMPMSQFGNGLRAILLCLPGTYGTHLLHNHYMGGVIKEMRSFLPDEVMNEMHEAFDLSLELFSVKIEVWMSYLILTATVSVLIAIFVLLNVFGRKKIKR